MENSLFLGFSLTASFFAGVLALFAPCCITFLLPSYLGTVFKSGTKVMLYTVLFAFGLASVLVPVALGFRLFIVFFDLYHSVIYYLGGFILIVMGVLTLKPFIHFMLPFTFNMGTPRADTSPFSIYILGLLSGLTSSCCAPVLFAAVTLTSLSTTTLQAFFVSFAYVLGIVFPLVVISLGYTKAAAFFSGGARQRIYNLFQRIGGLMFVFSGIFIIIFTYLGKIQMYQTKGYSLMMRNYVAGITKYVQNPVIDIVFFGVLLVLLIVIIQKNSTGRR